MAPSQRPSRSTRSSINYSWVPVDLKPLEPSTTSTTTCNDQRPPNEEPIGTILSTADLVSALGGVWRALGRHSNDAEGSASHLRGPHIRGNPKSGGCSRRPPRSEYDEVRAMRRWLLFDLGRRFLPENVTRDARRESSSGSHCDLGDTFRRASEVYFYSLRDLVNGKWNERKRMNRVISDISSSPSNDLVRDDGDLGGSVDDHVGLLDLEKDVTGLKSISRSSDSGRYVDRLIEFLVSYNSGIWECRANSLSTCKEVSGLGDDGMENVASEFEYCDASAGEGYDSQMPLSIKDTVSVAFAKRKYAISGAMAGTIVSLSLHPVDTVKTVVQARGLAEMSVYSTCRSIVAERGVTGLYRGIASNIASSAPISALYTFTYETVKGALLPLLPKEYHSLAHCTAGGCASIATSFVFTPSERIKQQMQVTSNYQNCWNALVGVLEKGGLQSLYAGWSAVLCRNIPHSIIKFYTYESLKQILLPPSQSDASLSTLQTLLCGGIAGSTAALFSTPFDVVKTKLQTQMPGSAAEYNGVFCMLKQIARNEGLSGLYRGLSPRLAMYMSQGAIFFASYEFFKAIFSL